MTLEQYGGGNHKVQPPNKEFLHELAFLACGFGLIVVFALAVGKVFVS